MISPEPDLVARLITSETPADVVHAAAACLAQMLDGFVWVRSRLALERRTAGRREVIGLAKSKYNRAGQLIEFRVESLTVFDDGLGAWRRSRPDLTVTRPASVESIVCASSFLDMSSTHSAVLTDPVRRLANLERFADHLRGTALPWFSGSGDPRSIASTAPDALLGPWDFAQDLMEFMVSAAQEAQARALWERVRELNPRHQEAFITGQAIAQSGGARPRWHTPEALGWSATTLGLA
ncbi:hypothetical protein AB0C76_15395 [Kitasatospora sp. NPDC048722]|uniref:hypothetical protein n=1 Tax=Kitasatospora sp. NPDC048722 TaxID=3155639 RepID=UPI0033C12CAD